jgi:hypothetical protein
MQNNEFGNQERLCKKLNYAGFEIEKVCYGFAAKGLEAILLMFLFRKEQKEGKKGGVHHPLKSFDERWRIIENERDTLKSINTKAKMDINAFFQGIMIYHAPYVFKELFEKVLFDGKQDLILSARLAQSRSIEMLGGMQKTLTLSGVYNGLILVLCLKAFREELEFQKIHYPVPLFVHANTHSIVIGYEPAKKNWILIDAERKCVHYMTNDKDMSYAIMLSYIRDYNIKDK